RPPPHEMRSPSASRQIDVVSIFDPPATRRDRLRPSIAWTGSLKSNRTTPPSDVGVEMTTVGGPRSAKVAVTFRGRSSVVEHDVGSKPEQAPPHESNSLAASGDASSDTVDPAANAWEHAGGQST